MVPANKPSTWKTPLREKCCCLAAGVIAFAFLVAGSGFLRAGDKKGQPAPSPSSKPTPATAPLLAGGGQVQAADIVNLSVVSFAKQIRFQFKIDPSTPLKDLLPVPPNYPAGTGPVLVDDLAKVPEVSFQAPRTQPTAEGLKQTAHAIAKINHLNEKKTDGFLQALLGDRPDLAGLPFAMGDSCRMKGARSQQFQNALTLIRQAMGDQSALIQQEVILRQVHVLREHDALIQARLSKATQQGAASGGSSTASDPELAELKSRAEVIRAKTTAFVRASWEKYRTACMQEDKTNAKCEQPHQENVTLARIAALMQVLGPESAGMRKGLVKHLAGISHAEATRALARLAIFSAEYEVRNAAVDALKIRRERDYTGILMQGLRYPWPAVAKRSADALVKLERNDLVPQLVDILDEPDPRLPVVKTAGKAPVVRELVRINHHRNCVMCHAPGTGNLSSEVLTAQVPIPGEPLPTPSQGYGNSQPDILVRLDITYLRQDFSAFQPVADAHPWPEMQRFDFLVRERALTKEEAWVYEEKLVSRKTGVLSPYQRSVLAALRELTGRDTEPSPQAWRKLLGLAAKAG